MRILLVVPSLYFASVACTVGQEGRDVGTFLTDAMQYAVKIDAAATKIPDLDKKVRATISRMPKDLAMIERAARDYKPPKEYVVAVQRNNVVLLVWTKKELNATGINAVVAVADDYAAKARNVETAMNTGRNPFAKIKVPVNTLDKNVPKNGYRVVCAPAAHPDDKDRRITFAKLSTPTTEELIPGKYWFWTQVDGDTSKQGEKIQFAVADNGRGERDPIDLPIPK